MIFLLAGFSAVICQAEDTTDLHVDRVLAVQLVHRDETPSPPPTPTLSPSPTNTITPTPTYSACFLAGTMIDTPCGSKPIELFHMGDPIYAVDPLSGMRIVTEVSDMWIVEADGYLIVHTVDGAEIRVTEHHPFYDVESNSFIEIGAFDVGDDLLKITSNGSIRVPIIRIERVNDTVTVFHPTVSHAIHTFLAEQFIVHNKTPTLTPTPRYSPTPFITITPTPSPTCPPCMPYLETTVDEVDDTAGFCSDADGNMDSGEWIDFRLKFYNKGSCGGSDCYAIIVSDNPHVTIEPLRAELGDIELNAVSYYAFRLHIDPVTKCREEVSLNCTAVASYCDSEFPFTATFEYYLEIDNAGRDWICDETQCDDVTPTPVTAGMELIMGNRHVIPDETFLLYYNLYNDTDSVRRYDAWVLLELNGSFWCYPSWIDLEQGFDYRPSNAVEPNSFYQETVLDFIWPDSVGAMSGLHFYGAALDSDTLELIGGLQIVSWSYFE